MPITHAKDADASLSMLTLFLSTLSGELPVLGVSRLDPIIVCYFIDATI